MADNQFFFTKEALQGLINRYACPDYAASRGIKSSMGCRGFVFTMGTNQDGHSRAFAFPLFSENEKAGSDDDIIFQNTSYGMGCPFPPKCNDDTDPDGNKLSAEISGNNSCYGPNIKK